MNEPFADNDGATASDYDLAFDRGDYDLADDRLRVLRQRALDSAVLRGKMVMLLCLQERDLHQQEDRTTKFMGACHDARLTIVACLEAVGRIDAEMPWEISRRHELTALMDLLSDFARIKTVADLR